MDEEICSLQSACMISNNHHPQTPSRDESKKDPSMIVLALSAPTRMENSQKPRKKMRNLRTLNHRMADKRHTFVSVIFKFNDLYTCCISDYLLAKKLTRLRLSGCAVISKGILVVEGAISSVKRFSRFMRLELIRENHLMSDSPVKVIWQGNVCRPSFGLGVVIHEIDIICMYFGI